MLWAAISEIVKCFRSWLRTHPTSATEHTFSINLPVSRLIQITKVSEQAEYTWTVAVWHVGYDNNVDILCWKNKTCFKWCLKKFLRECFSDCSAVWPKQTVCCHGSIKEPMLYRLSCNAQQTLPTFTIYPHSLGVFLSFLSIVLRPLNGPNACPQDNIYLI